ncbi:MAG: TQO small subunit DoxD [Acidimicrobiales bacterium]
MTTPIPIQPPAISPDDHLSRAVMAGLRIAIGIMWLTNTRWKTPTDFGRSGGGGLYGFTKDAVDHPVFPPYSWFVEHVVLPNFTAFAWGVFLLEVSLGAFLILGLATRLWGVVGGVQSLAIGLSVARTPNEWAWSYILMIAANLALAATAAGRYGGLDGVLRPTWMTRGDKLSRLLVKTS